MTKNNIFIFYPCDTFKRTTVKILSVSNLYNPFVKRIPVRTSETSTIPSFNTGQLQGDVITFRAKKYDVDSIVNPTNHCAYCGCKVYSEAQIESLAKSMLNSKSHRLQGDIKSVLEKLESAVRSEELTFAKKVENREEIEFFRKFQQLAEDKSFLKGDAIFSQVYNLNQDEALEVLKRNMRPLTRTVDHVSPQNLDEDNNNADINLVEACYCCNHDLKKGVSFPEFYAMFPSIKENMPTDKFQYAYSNLMSSSASSVLNRMSATNLLKHVQRLFGQREEAVTRLGSIDFRILEANTSVLSSIQTCKDEIVSKQDEIAELQLKLDTISVDDEYQALITRIQKNQQLEQINTTLQSLRERRQGVSNALNELRNPPKKTKKAQKTQMTKEEKEQRIQEYKESISTLNQDISTQESKRDDVELEIMELNSQFPTIDMLQAEKTRADAIVNAHTQLIRENSNLEQLTKTLESHKQNIARLKEEIAQYPESEFDISAYSEEEQAQYQRYNSLLEASKYIEGHSAGAGIKSIINLAAKNSIDTELSELALLPVVCDANDSLKKKELQSKLDTAEKQKTDVENQINASKKTIVNLTRTTSVKTMQEAQKESQEIAAHIRIINEKQNYLKLPSTIASLKAEIILLQQTIKDLEAKQVEIEQLKSVQS